MPSSRPLAVGSVPWSWSTSVVCGGPSGRLIVTRGLSLSDSDAKGALLDAVRMEWRDASLRRWTIDREPAGLRFETHYEKLGPVSLDASRPLASLTDAELEGLLARARREE